MRLLVVEDEAEMRTVLKRSFEAEGFNVDEAENGARGSFLARTNDYDVILLDNALPGKQGLQVCRDIRDSGRTVPIIIVSALLDTVNKVALLNGGADDYVCKPYSFGELLARVHAVMRRPAAFVGKILTVGDLVMDTQNMSVTRGSQNIDLSKKEFTFLEYLMKNQGRVMSHALIMEHVWDMNADPLSNTIETHILHLRKKIEAPNKIKLIHTVPGRGYKIDVKS